MSTLDPAESTNDPLQLTAEELLSIYGTSAPGGRVQVNAVRAPSLYGGELIVQGDVYIYGCIQTPLRLCAGIYFGDGTETMPSITFANDPSTGFYRAGTGLIGVTSGGVADMIIGNNAIEMLAPITTPIGQNLVIDPSGPSIDFTGHTLINVGGISTNPNYFTVAAPATLITTDATPATLLTVTTTASGTYLIQTTVSVANDSDSISSAAFTISTKAKNLGGTVTLIPYATDTQVIDTGLAGITVVHAVSGTGVVVTCTGLAATTIKWFGVSVVTRQLF